MAKQLRNTHAGYLLPWLEGRCLIRIAVILTIMAMCVSANAQSRYEAETSNLGNATVAASYTGYSGSGYVTGLTSEWSRIQFDRSVQNNTTARIDIRYSNATGGTVTNLALYIGSSRVQGLSFPTTSSWTTWQTLSVTFPLAAGYQNIVIKGETNVSSSVNIDYSDLTLDVSAAPGPFAQTAPANVATGVSTTPNFTWGASSTATSYALVVSTSSSYTSPVINQTSLTSTSYTPSVALANSTTYYWKVTAVNGSGSTVSSNAGISFTTAAPVPAPGSFSQTVPAASATSVSTLPTFNWGASTNAATYSLVVSTSSTYTSPVINKTGLTSTSYTATASLSNSTVYYWKVTAVNSSGSTIASNAGISFTTAALAAPGTFSQTNPSASATDVSVVPTFTWGASSDAASYSLVVATNSSYSSPIINQTGLTSTSYTSTVTLANNTTYYWKVTAVNTASSTVASNGGISFRTIAASSGGTRYEAESQNISNGSAASVYSGYSGSGYVTGLNSEWSSVKFDKSVSDDTNAQIDIRYANGSGAAISNLALYVGSNKIQTITFGSTGSWSTWNTVSVTFSLPAGYQNISLISEASVSTSVNVDYFDLTTGIVIPPGSFSLLAPANNAVDVAVKPAFSWGSSSNAASYTLVVSTSSSYASPVINQSVTGNTYSPTTALANSTKYYWKVTATNASASTVATNAGIAFTTKAPVPLPGAFTQTAPASAATGVSSTPTFSWASSTAAATYSLIVSTSSTYTSPIINQTGLTSTSYTPSSPLGSTTTYYWKVTAVNETGSTVSTNAGISFTTQALPLPTAFTQTTPAANATSVSRTTNFVWGASTNAATYSLVVSTNSSYASPVINVSGLTSTSYSHSSSLAGSTVYYWKVTAINASGNRVATNAGISFTTNATTGTYYYVSTAGVDAVGRGSSANPFKTIAYAASQVPSGQNNTIYINAGTYSETQAIKLPVGVNLEGAGESSVTITSAGAIPAPGVDQSSGDWKLWYDGSLIQLVSASYNNDITLKYGDPEDMTPAANGDQILSGFTIDGNNKQIKAGVWVQNRNNVTMHHVTIQNCQQRGAVFGRSDMWWYIPLPEGKWMNNTNVYDCTFTNNGAQLGSESLGNLCLAGLDGAEIKNLTINDNVGYGIKFIFVGHYRNVKIHDCTINVSETDPAWGEKISIELWNLSYGNEVYNINCNTWHSYVNHGSITSYEPTGTNTNNLKVYNVRMIDSDGSSSKEAIEAALSGVEIYNCFVQDKGFGIAIWNGAGQTLKKNYIIRNNIIANVNRTPGFGFGKSSGVFVPDAAQNIKIYNNVFDNLGNGLNLDGASGVEVKNNVFINTLGADVENGSSVTFNNNLKYHTDPNKTNWNLTGGPTVGSANVLGMPGFQNSGARYDTYYKPASSSSFVVDKGVNVGLPFNGTAPDIGRWEYSSSGRTASVNLSQSENLQEDSDFDFLVYPNPSKGIVTFTAGRLKIRSVEVYSMQGNKLVLSRSLDNAEQFDLDFSSYSSDRYLVKIAHEDGIVVRKVLIIH